MHQLTKLTVAEFLKKHKDFRNQPGEGKPPRHLELLPEGTCSCEVKLTDQGWEFARLAGQRVFWEYSTDTIRQCPENYLLACRNAQGEWFATPDAGSSINAHSLTIVLKQHADLDPAALAKEVAVAFWGTYSPRDRDEIRRLCEAEAERLRKLIGMAAWYDGAEKVLTFEEKAEVIRLWQSMSGSSCWNDAFLCWMKGETAPTAV